MTPDEQALRAIVTEFQKTWNASDSIGLASLFSVDASFIHIYGGQLDGRMAIEASHRQIFDTVYKGSRLEYEVNSVRFLRPDVAAVLLEARLQFRERGDAREIHARPTMVATKEDGKWQVVLFQNTRVSDMPGGPALRT